ncbi:LuxR family transcriptional regulator [Planctomonas sp. JC2975]|uniref:AAA family ATPase n=1 Tax=Planctomonas sp. JC2975 TaxID=2729626 RepID=UPI00197C34B8
MASARASTLLGRRTETQLLDHLISSLRGGQSRSLVIRGEAGVGKSALVEHVASRASGCRVVKAFGVESEVELAYAGLHQLCAPLLDHLDALTAPQATALGVALGVQSGGAPDRFLVGLAVLNLFSAAAADKPLVCLVDDAQWLDLASRQTLAFVARRLVAESVGIVFAVRDPSEDPTFAGIETLVVGGLAEADARSLLDSVLAGPIDVAVRDRIVAETAGNPLALTELSRGLSPADIAGGFGLSAAPGMGSRIEGGYVRRIEALPEATRRILAVAAVEPVGDPGLVLKAAEHVGVTADALTPAMHDGLLDVGVKLRFRHPLMRSAALRAATPEQIAEAHRALAEATDPVTDPDRRAWHRAEAVVGFDEEVAADLVRSARRAQARGGLAAGAAFHQRAVELTPDPNIRARRALMAAEDKFRAGATSDALTLLELATPAQLDDHQRARAELVRARVAHAVTRGKDAPRLLLRAAERLAPHDPEASIAIYADAVAAAFSSGSLAVGVDLRDVAAAILHAPADPQLPATEAAWETLRSIAVLVTEGYEAGAPLLRTSLRTLTSTVRDATARAGAEDAPLAVDASVQDPAADQLPPAEPVDSGGPPLHVLRRGLGIDAVDDDGLHWLALGSLAARILSDDVAYDEFTALQLQQSYRSGALAQLPMAMSERFSALMWSGRMSTAESLAYSVQAIIQATDALPIMNRMLWLYTFRGDDAAALQIIDAPRDDVYRRGEGQWLISIACGGGMLLNALGRYSDAFDATSDVAGHPFDVGLAAWILPERIEAAVRTGNTAEAAAAVARLNDIADACATDWALGVAARSSALAADDADAERLYLRSIELLGRTGQRATLARSHLVYGEWLRRANRRVEARDQLRLAHAMLSDMGIIGFAERARRELFATGETVHRRSADPLEDLTSQEMQIAALAAGGGTNPEIGAQLYLSPRTVEWHLRKVFTKLGITSRRQLAGALGR